jgi:3-hydroxybutyryl-CoA dehydratase
MASISHLTFLQELSSMKNLFDQFYVEIGETVRQTKTVSESDVYGYAGITGDFSGNHVNEEQMKLSKYGRRIAHGALVVGFMSTASSTMFSRHREKYISQGVSPVSLGYDRVRFLGPVFFGDTITVAYTIKTIESDKARIRADIAVTNQRGELIAVAENITKWVPTKSAAAIDAGSDRGKSAI